VLVTRPEFVAYTTPAGISSGTIAEVIDSHRRLDSGDEAPRRQARSRHRYVNDTRPVLRCTMRLT